MHELYHVLMKHPIRMKSLLEIGYDYETILIACDAKTNYAILDTLSSRMDRSSFNQLQRLLDTFGIPEELLETGSVEEIVLWLTDKGFGSGGAGSPTAGNDVKGAEATPQPSQGEEEEDEESQGGTQTFEEFGAAQTLNEGSGELVNTKTLEELEQKLSKVIRDSLLSAKMAGTQLSGIEERILESLVKSKVDWRAMFRNYLQMYVKKNVIQTFKKANRRIRDLPGIQPISRPRAWVFVDVSGSINQQEYDQFMSEVVKLSSHVSETVLVTWDTKVTAEKKFKGKITPDKVSVKFRGKGGTKFSPVISQYIKWIKPNDVVIVLTDGYWSDPNVAEDILKQIRALKILVTTVAEVPGFDKVVKIRVKESW